MEEVNMIIKEKIGSSENVYYKVYSDVGFYVENKKNKALFTEVFTTVPDDFEETSIIIEEITNEIINGE